MCASKQFLAVGDETYTGSHDQRVYSRNNRGSHAVVGGDMGGGHGVCRDSASRQGVLVAVA